MPTRLPNLPHQNDRAGSRWPPFRKAPLCLTTLLALCYVGIYLFDRLPIWWGAWSLVHGRADVQTAAKEMYGRPFVFINNFETDPFPTPTEYLREGSPFPKPLTGTLIFRREVSYPLFSESRQTLIEFEKGVAVRVIDDELD